MITFTTTPPSLQHISVDGGPATRALDVLANDKLSQNERFLLFEEISTALDSKLIEMLGSFEQNAEAKRLADIAAKQAEVDAERLAKEELLKPEKQKRIEALEKQARDHQAEADKLKLELGVKANP